MQGKRSIHWDRLKVGDKVLVASSTNSAAAMAHKAGKRHGKKFTTHRLSCGVVEVTCIDDTPLKTKTLDASQADA